MVCLPRPSLQMHAVPSYFIFERDSPMAKVNSDTFHFAQVTLLGIPQTPENRQICSFANGLSGTIIQIQNLVIRSTPMINPVFFQHARGYPKDIFMAQNDRSLWVLAQEIIQKCHFSLFRVQNMVKIFNHPVIQA